MAHVREVERHDAARTIYVLRVVHDEVGVERQGRRGSLLACQHRTLVRRAARVAVAEVIPLRCRNLDLAVVGGELVAEVAAEAVLAIGTAHVLAVEQGKAVLYRVAAVGVAATLQGVEIVVVAGAR